MTSGAKRKLAAMIALGRIFPLLGRNGRLGIGPLLRERAEPLKGTGIYIAGRFGRRDELGDVARELESAGATVTSRWLFDDGGPLENAQLRPDGRGRRMAEMDLEDVRAADICLAFTERPDEAQGRGGRHTELGIALALGRRVIVVGPREQVFHCLPTVEHFPNWEIARRALGLVDRAVLEPVGGSVARHGLFAVVRPKELTVLNPTEFALETRLPPPGD
jgi:hypothetical protein